MKKIKEKLDVFCESKWMYLLIVLIAFTFILFLSKTTSIKYNQLGFDSSVFRMMGYVITEGGVPYVDYFDHKGPILYFINALGEIISPKWGLFLLQVVSCFFVILLWQKTARIFIRPTYSFLSLLFSIAIWSGIYENGNLTEEYSLLPSSLSIYLAVSYLTRKETSPHPYWLSLVHGLCFGIMFYIRPNDAVIQCGGVMIGIFLYLIFIPRLYKNAILNALTFLAGFMIVSFPIIIYFYSHNAINQFFFGLIGFNLNYNGGIINNILNYQYTVALIALCAIPIILACSSDQKKVLWILFPITCFTIIFFGRNGYPHYYMSLMPAFFVLMFTFLFLQRNKYLVIVTVILIIMIPNRFGGKTPNFQYAYRGYTIIKNEIKTLARGSLIQRTNKAFDETEKLFALIPQEEKDSVWNYNDMFSSMFYHNKIIAQNPVVPVVAYQHQNFPDDKLPVVDITANRPLWVFFNGNSPQYIFPADSSFLANNYQVIAKSDSAICSYYLLKRKGE